MVFDPYCIGNDITDITMLYGRMWGRDEKNRDCFRFSGFSPLVAGFYAFKMDVYLTIVDVDDER